MEKAEQEGGAGSGAGGKVVRFRDQVRRAWAGLSWSERVLAAVLLLVTAALFWPALVWMGRETVVHEQMQHAFMVLLIASAALWQTEGRHLPVVLRMGRKATGYLAGSFVILAAALALRSGFLLLVAGSLAVVGWMVFFSGGKAERTALGVVGVFVGYTLLILLLPLLDWPLRLNAGQQTAWVLNLVGVRTSLLLVESEVPKLVLLVGRQPFEVAAECNGFGLLASTLLVAILLATFRKLGWLDKGLLLVIAVMLAVAGNTLRILGIVALAPLFPARAYMTVHEAVGITFFWGTLLVLWWMANGLGPAESRAAGREADEGLAREGN